MTFNGVSYTVPAYNDTGWAQGIGNLSSYLVAIASGTLQTTGGTFTLSADVNFGATYGLLAAYFKTRAASPATAGLFRLALTDTINWGVANNALGVSGTALQWNGTSIQVGLIPLATGVSGILPIANGGTNAATIGANVVFAGPTSGGAAAPSFRALVAADLVAAVTENREVYTVGTAHNNYTGSTTVFNLVAAYVTNGVNLWVAINGLDQPLAYYTETSTLTVTLSAPANTGDIVEFRWTTY